MSTQRRRMTVMCSTCKCAFQTQLSYFLRHTEGDFYCSKECYHKAMHLLAARNAILKLRRKKDV